MSITICDTHLTRTVRYLSLTFEPVYNQFIIAHLFLCKIKKGDELALIIALNDACF